MSLLELAIFTAPIISGTLSLFASVTIIWKIFQSNTKLKAPYCRIIFGLSFYDVIFSCANIASTMPVPAVSSTYFGAIGNDITCSIQGIIFASAGGFMPFYNLSLCIYFYCIMNKFSLSTVNRGYVESKCVFEVLPCVKLSKSE